MGILGHKKRKGNQAPVLGDKAVIIRLDGRGAPGPRGPDKPRDGDRTLLFRGTGRPLRKLEPFDEADIQRRTWEPFTPGTRWECLRCGRCCRESWRVNLTWKEYDRLKDVLDINGVVLDERTGMSHPVMELEGICKGLDPEKNLCTIYRKRMYSCATFPFSLSPEGVLMVSRYCQGFGSGPLLKEEELAELILRWRKKAGKSTGGDCGSERLPAFQAFCPFPFPFIASCVPLPAR